MNKTVEPLILDLLEWLHDKPRAVADVLAVWQTSCPRMPVWEEAERRGFVRRRSYPNVGTIVEVTVAGQSLLENRRSQKVRGPDSTHPLD